MSSNKVKTDPTLPVPLYKEVLNKIDFAQVFLDDPEIFNSNSATSRNFLIQAFAYIHPDFHYLSFLNKEIDQEIIRAAEILQILPSNGKKSDKLFDNLSESEIKGFWSRLFALLHNKKESDFNINTVRTSEEKNFDFLKDISKTLDYVQYELPVLKEKNFSNDTLNEEIEKWNTGDVQSSQAQDFSFINYDTYHLEHINIEKLLMDLKQVTSMLKNIQFTNKVNVPEHVEYFSNFTSLTQNIHQYITDLNGINSLFLEDLYNRMVEPELVHPSSLYFLKKCSNYFKTLECNKFP